MVEEKNSIELASGQPVISSKESRTINSIESLSIANMPPVDACILTRTIYRELFLFEGKVVE